MYEYNPQTGQWEDPEERRKREDAQAKSLGTTEVGKREIITHADGSQTHKTTQEVPNPGFFERLGSAFQQAGSNFVNNIQNAPQNFVNNVGNLGQQQPRPQPQPQPTQQPFAAMPIAPEMPQVDYSMATQQGGPGLRYGQAFAPQQAQQQPQQPVAQPAVPGQPQTQPQPYDARAAAVAQRESGGNFDIGYHFPADEQGRRKSSAYGGFGITAPAYQDIQRANPAFANRPITSLNAQEQRQAFDTLSNLNAQRLQKAGVEATPQNLDLAHFFGAGGAANYLKNGYISPQAAQANGGADKVRAVADKILSGQQVAVSGAAEPGAVQAQAQPAQPAVTPVQAGITAYQTSQDDPMALLRLRNDQNQPEFIRQRAANRAYEIMDAEIKAKEAETMRAKLTPQEMSRVLTKRSEGNTVGDWLQYLLFKHVGLTDLANEKGEQLGIGSKWAGAMDQHGNTGMIKYTASGMPLEGVKDDGTEMNKGELAAYASQGAGKSSDVSLTMHQATVNGELHTFESKRTPQGLLYRDATANGKWSRTAPQGMMNIGQQDPAHLKGLSAMKTVMEKYRKDSLSASQSTGKPLYTEEQIQAAGNQAYQSITGKPFAGMPGATTMPAATTTPAVTTTPATATAAPAMAAGAKSLAQQILDYEAPSPPASARDAGSVALRNEVNKLAAEQGRTYNAGNFKLATGFNNSQSGKALKSINVAVDHLDTLQEAANELKNGPTPAFNKIANLYATNTGQTAPGNFNALKSIVGSEVAKAVVGGASALGDREEIRKEINDAKTPEQLAGIIGRFQALMAGQAKGIRQEWVSSGLDEKTFDAKLMPRTRVVLNQQKQPTRSNY